MNSRDHMLATIKANQPTLIPLPDEFRFNTSYTDNLAQFSAVLASIGGLAVEVPDYLSIETHLQQLFPKLLDVVTTLPELAHLADVSLVHILDPHELASVNLAIIEGQWAVAENGAIWVDEQHLPHRALPMITQFLAIVIHRTAIVPNMHNAYEQIRVNKTGFGTFIAGPSKTADIEQSLVIGAHGARSLVVYVLPD
ncbi:LUD domain-containing protein [Fibrella sp. HMF5335]|uniref:LUD domain-containing protein n=1 Tax=Fibrella rubiginis TaxID=2817060 RepID=A0A939GP23_9BACT|nr:LUD domain-containing protein [Fibrella rubiginis]MBO0940007.1 LUD domain-containing protein [Fibrella rubiginis]